MALPAHVRVDVFFGGIAAINTSCGFYYTLAAGSINFSNVYQVADEIKADWLGPITQVLTIHDALRLIRVTYHNGPTLVSGDSTDNASAGEQDGDTLPEEDCVVIRRLTGKSGRSKRGRVFWPLVPEVFNEEGALTVGAIDKYRELAYKFKLPLVLPVTGVTLNPVQPDYKNGVLEPVIQTAVVVEVLNRRQRRNPRYSYAVPAPL